MASYNAPTTEGEILPMLYSGTVDEITIQVDGVYRIEVWGSQGSKFYNLAGGLGGYSAGNIELKSGDIIYSCIGGHFPSRTEYDSIAGGPVYGPLNNRHWAHYTHIYWHNNVDGRDVNMYCMYAFGGGCTHMAFVPGQLKDIGYATFVSNKKGIIVAGGGGASGGGDIGGGTGGAGGGINGTGGAAGLSEDSYYTFAGGGMYGTQTSGGKTGTRQDYRYEDDNVGLFGVAANKYGGGPCGGGSGLFAGGHGAAVVGNTYGGGGGGSGYLSPILTEASMTTGVQTGVGRAAITLVNKTTPPVYIDGVKVTKIIFNGVVLGS